MSKRIWGKVLALALMCNYDAVNCNNAFAFKSSKWDIKWNGGDGDMEIIGWWTECENGMKNKKYRLGRRSLLLQRGEGRGQCSFCLWWWKRKSFVGHGHVQSDRTSS